MQVGLIGKAKAKASTAAPGCGVDADIDEPDDEEEVPEEEGPTQDGCNDKFLASIFSNDVTTLDFNRQKAVRGRRRFSVDAQSSALLFARTLIPAHRTFGGDQWSRLLPN